MATTVDFLTEVRRLASLPSSVADSTILAFADTCIASTLWPLVQSMREGYGVHEVDVVVSTRTRLPARAVAAGVRDVQLKVGNTTTPLARRDMSEADSTASGGLPQAYYLDAGGLVLWPRGTSGTLRLRYVVRPGKLVLSSTSSAAAQVTAVSSDGTTVTLTAAYTGSLSGGMDIVANSSAHHLVGVGVTLSGTSPTFTVPLASLVEVPQVGDWLAAADTTPVIPLPEELRAALAHQTAAEVLHALGYLEEATSHRDVAARVVEAAVALLRPRNEGNPVRVRGGLWRGMGRGASWVP